MKEVKQRGRNIVWHPLDTESKMKQYESMTLKLQLKVLIYLGKKLYNMVALYRTLFCIFQVL